VSVIIGFLNVFLWSANVWFLYKETKWYRPNPGKSGVISLTQRYREIDPLY
jgi:hypothetical protein